MHRITVFIFLLGALASLTAAESAPLFCKCTCFTNSTIIALGPQSPSSPSPSSSASPSGRDLEDDDDDHQPLSPRHALAARAASASCTQCNRAFCLEYNLPICKGAEEKDVVTMCFQRDSRKDQVIVWAFILGTAGLLGWAGAQRALELRASRASSARPGPPGAAPAGLGGILGGGAAAFRAAASSSPRGGDQGSRGTYGPVGGVASGGS